MTARVLAVVALPDDETFGCGSMLLHAVAAGARTTVCATGGEAGGVAPSVQVPEEGLSSLWENELRAAAAAVSVERTDLDFTDSGMDGKPPAGSLCGVPCESVLDAVAAAVAAHEPDVVLALDASDGHRDHAQIRAVVEKVTRGSATRLYLQALPEPIVHRHAPRAQPVPVADRLRVTIGYCGACRDPSTRGRPDHLCRRADAPARYDRDVLTLQENEIAPTASRGQADRNWRLVPAVRPPANNKRRAQPIRKAPRVDVLPELRAVEGPAFFVSRRGGVCLDARQHPCARTKRRHRPRR